MLASPEEIQQVAIGIIFAKANRSRRAYRRHQLLLRENERMMQPPVKEFMDYMTGKLKAGISRMSGKSPTQKAKSIADWGKIREKGEEILKPALFNVLNSGGNSVTERELKKQARFDPIGIEAIDWTNAHSAELVVEITQETMTGIRDVIATGIQAGKSMPAIAKELRPIVGLNSQYAGAVGKLHTNLIEQGVTAQKAAAQAERYAGRLHRRRTTTIARTETAFSLSEGQRQGYGQMGVENLERVEDPACCDICAEYNGKIYSVKEAEGVLPEHPNCEGTWVMSGKVKSPTDYADELSNHAKKYEPGITRSMKRIASDTGTTLNKLEFRLKSPGSIKRKIASIVKENPSMSLEQAVKGIQDTVRYTTMAPTKNFAAIVNKIDIQLGKQGYKLKKATNYYGKKGPYQGINTKYFDPKSNLTFEVQYHTKQSIEIVEKNHLIYEKARISTNPAVMDKMNTEMIRNWDDFVMPEGAPKLFGGGK